MSWSPLAKKITRSAAQGRAKEVIVTMSGEFFNPGPRQYARYQGFELKNPKPGYYVIYPYSKVSEWHPPPTSPGGMSIMPLPPPSTFLDVTVHIPLPAGNYQIGVCDHAGGTQWHLVSVIDW